MQRASHLPVDQTLLNYVIEGNLDKLKQYCKNGFDRAKFYEIMTLGISDESLRRSQDKGKTAVAIAAKNARADLLNFIITEANKDEPGRRLLADHLVGTNQEGKNPLHESAGIPNNHHVITLLCTAASDLTSRPLLPTKDSDKLLAAYANNPDSELGTTALHFAARQCVYLNFDALVNAGANINTKSKNNMTALQLVSKNDPTKSQPFMLSYLQTPAGHSYFRSRHGYDLSRETDPSIPADKKCPQDC